MDLELAKWNKLLNCYQFYQNTVSKCAICRNHLYKECLSCQIYGFYQTYCDITILTCDHVYHTHCFNRWLQRRGICPICNGNPDELNDFKQYDLTEIYIRILQSLEHIDFKKIIHLKLNWTTDNHKYWPKNLKDQIFMLLLLYKSKQLKVVKLVLFRVFEFLAKTSMTPIDAN